MVWSYMRLSNIVIIICSMNLRLQSYRSNPSLQASSWKTNSMNNSLKQFSLAINRGGQMTTRAIWISFEVHWTLTTFFRKYSVDKCIFVYRENVYIYCIFRPFIMYFEKFEFYRFQRLNAWHVKPSHILTSSKNTFPIPENRYKVYN